MSSGIGGLDIVLQGGFFKGGLYLIQGTPGTGKTMIANQICFNHVAGGNRAIAASLLMISVDGLKPEYVLDADAHGLKIPFLRGLMRDGAYARGVTGVWPTVTYPSHTTLLTGLSPADYQVLLALKVPDEQLLAAETVLRRNATVRSTERMVARLLGIGRGRRKARRAVSESGATATAVEDLQNRLQQHLATHVTIHHGDKRGRIEIEYYGTDDLQRVVNALGLPEITE